MLSGRDAVEASTSSLPGDGFALTRVSMRRVRTRSLRMRALTQASYVGRVAGLTSGRASPISSRSVAALAVSAHGRVASLRRSGSGRQPREGNELIEMLAAATIAMSSHQLAPVDTTPVVTIEV
jgi:hypothetical protein